MTDSSTQRHESNTENEQIKIQVSEWLRGMQPLTDLFYFSCFFVFFVVKNVMSVFSVFSVSSVVNLVPHDSCFQFIPVLSIGNGRLRYSPGLLPLTALNWRAKCAGSA